MGFKVTAIMHVKYLPGKLNPADYLLIQKNQKHNQII